jgi:hypothetical protein
MGFLLYLNAGRKQHLRDGQGALVAAETELLRE